LFLSLVAHFLEKAFSAGALVVAAPLLSESARAQQAGIWQPSVYLGIEPSGDVKIVPHRSEMGTGCRSGLPMIVADELEADWNRVQIIQGSRRCQIRIAEHGWVLFGPRLL
jgi:hypothetical protein